MKQQLFIIILVFFSLSSFAQPAFPGAEGFGSTTPGGRGGAVLFVTNLNNAPKRDTVDKRVIQHVLDGSGKIIDSQMDVGGWPFYFSATPPLDMDNDGISDYWEIANGLDRNNPSDANLKTLCPNGWYTNIEMYINSLITDLTTHVSNIPFQTKALSDMGNYPNPFKYSTEIKFGLAINSNVTISVMDTMGKEILRLIDNEPFLKGIHEIAMQRGRLTPGIYFYQINAGNYLTSSKIMVYN